MLGVGATEAERNLAWYSDIDVPQTAQLAKAAEVQDGVFPETAVTVGTSAGGQATSGEYFRSAAPARATVEVARLPRDVKIEIAAIVGRR